MPATDDYLRNIKTMHKVFCLSAVVLLACTVWMMWADYADEWRGYQRSPAARRRATRPASPDSGGSGFCRSGRCSGRKSR
jgi:hypothetical protein